MVAMETMNICINHMHFCRVSVFFFFVLFFSLFALRCLNHKASVMYFWKYVMKILISQATP